MENKISSLRNYSAILSKNINKHYPKLTEPEKKLLVHELIFAPKNYQTEIDNNLVPIKDIRQNLAEQIEREAAEKNFIPYSLDAEIADLIEQHNCETSSINEYYRWVSATNEILQNANDGEVTDEDLQNRKNFISLSYEREAELLLCLGLYEATNNPLNKEKINLLHFKLARLRELRSIVKNVPDTKQHKHSRNNFDAYCEYCHQLLQNDISQPQNINLKLKINLNIDDINDEDLESNKSFWEYLQETVLLLMRALGLSHEQPQNTKTFAEEKLLTDIVVQTKNSAKNKTV